MVKPKLTDALKPAAASGAAALPPVDQQSTQEAPAAKPAATGNGGDAPRSDTAGEDAPADEAGDATPADDKKELESKPAEASIGGKTLADYRAAFGHAEGTLYFAEQTSFLDAGTKHMAAQAATNAAQAAKIAELQKTNTTLANQLKGEAEPLATGPQGKGTSKGVDAVAEFAASAEQRLAARSGK